MKPNLRQNFSVAWLLAKREVQQGLRGFRVFLLCIAIGTGAIATIYSAIEGLTTTLRDSAQPILGGDIEVEFTHVPAPDAMLSFFARQADQQSTIVTARSIVRTGRPEATPLPAGVTNQLLVELKVVDSLYPLYGTLKTKAAPAARATVAPPPSGNQAYVHPSLLRRLGVQVGDSLDLGATTVTIAGLIDQEPDLLSAGGVLIGPRVMVSFDALAESQLLQPGSLLYYAYRLKIADNDKLGETLGALNTEFGDPYWQTRDVSDAAPSTRSVLEQLRVFMTTTAIVALFIGGIGAGNAIRAWVEQKTPVIALWRSLGASGRIIGMAMFLLIALMAVIGIALGIGVSILASLFVLPSISVFIPLAPQAGIYSQSLLVAAMAGALIALIFSLPPVFRARRISPAVLLQGGRAVAGALSVREMLVMLVPIVALIGLAIFSVESRVLAGYIMTGIISSVLVLWVFVRLMMAAYRRMPIPSTAGWRISRAWLTHPGNRSTEVFISLGLGLTIIAFIGLLESNLRQSITQDQDQAVPTLFFTDIQPQQFESFATLIERNDGFERMDSAPMLRGRITHLNGVPASTLRAAREEEGDDNGDGGWVLEGDRGITWSRTAPNDGVNIVAGEWWSETYQDDQLLVSFDADAAAAFGIGLGDTLTFNLLGRSLTATIANLREINWRTFAMNFVMVFSPGILERAPQTRLATVYLDDDADLVVLEAAVINQFPNITPIRVRDVLERIRALIGGFAVAIRVIGLIAIFAGMVVLSSVIASENRQRSLDATILKVLGARRTMLIRVFMAEFFVLGTVSAVLASAIAIVGSYFLITRVFEAEWAMSWSTLAITIGLGLLVSSLLGFVGAWQRLGASSMTWLRNE
ncbi:MAG: ABC transporter permease [Alphaproteobacteria bacterium]|nr:ABC transporter permease [Alphaproteobacteria bacterium]